jgi:hypothetical protein
MVKAALEYYKVISRGPLLAGKVLEVLARLITPSTIVEERRGYLISEERSREAIFLSLV